MSKIYVDEIAGIASADTVAIPGHVIQVVNGSSSADITITSTGFSDIGLSASITPTSASSKILVVTAIPCMVYTESVYVQAAMNLLRDSTSIDSTANIPAMYVTGASNAMYTRFTYNQSYLDSPATTSAITYKVQSKVTDASSARQIRINQNDESTSTITLMEIAG